MPSLIVRDLDKELIQQLKLRAARHARSAEAEHRSILEEALLKTRRRSLADILASMPDVGTDADFEREPDPDSGRVFD